MKLKQIEKLCKEAGCVRLFDDFTVEYVEDEEFRSGRQWMSDGTAAFPLDGLPYLDEAAVYAIFDVDAKKQDKLVVERKDALPTRVSFDDLRADDVPLEAVRFRMSIGSHELALFRDPDGGLVVIRADYKKPFDNWRECECFKRMSADGNPFVAVMSGCILRGLIGTYIIGADMVETLGAVYNAAGVALAEAKKGEEENEE